MTLIGKGKVSICFRLSGFQTVMTLCPNIAFPLVFLFLSLLVLVIVLFTFFTLFLRQAFHDGYIANMLNRLNDGRTANMFVHELQTVFKNTNFSCFKKFSTPGHFALKHNLMPVIHKYGDLETGISFKKTMLLGHIFYN